MARNGDGTYTRTQADYVYDTVIDESAVNSEFDDLGAEIARSIATDGQSTITANIPMNSKKFTGMTNGSARTDSLTLGQAQDSGFLHATSISGADTITGSLTPAITAYATGQSYTFVSAGANTTAVTININSVGAKAITKNGTTALVAGDISSGALVHIVYDGTQFQLINVKAGDLLSTNNLSDLGSASTARTNLGLVIGTDVLAEADTPIGKQTIFVPASAMRATTSNGAASINDVETTSGRPDITAFDFDSTADEHVQFQVAMPKSWNLGTVTAQFFWESTAADTDGVTWAIQGVAITDNESIDTAYGTAVTVDDANQSAAEELLVSAESGAITIAGTPADDDMCFFRVFRDVSDANDTATEDARLIGVKLFITTDAGEDT